MKKIKKLVILMFIILSFFSLCKVKAETNLSYDEYKVGDEIEYQGIKFFVIQDSDSTSDYVTLLKKTPLLIDEINKYGIDENGVNHINRYISESNGVAYNPYINSYKNTSYGSIAYYTNETCKDLIDSECTTDYADSEIKYVIDGWASAKLGLEDLVTDKFGYKVRLLTLGELTDNLGYTLKNGETSYSFTKDISPDWVYNNSYSYWTMSPYEDYNSSICIVSYDGNIYNDIVSDYRENTVRPVINLKKESIKKENLPEMKTIDSKVFKIGDILEYNGVKFYAIENSDNKKNTVALLKAEPLTVDEVNKYGKGYVNKDTVNKEAMDVNGYGSVAYYSSDTCKDYSGNNTGCTSEYSKSDVKCVLDNWQEDVLKDFPLIEDDLGYKVRLITLNELVNNLNFSANSNGIYYASEQTPSFVYSKLYRYLTMSPTDDSNSSVYTVADSLNANVSSALPTVGGYTTFTGVIRPVIILDKTGGIVSDIVSVPDTFLTKSLIFIGIGLSIIIISITITLVILKKQKRVNN